MRRSAAAYQKFTEDEIRQANSVDILSLARGYGYEPEKAGRKAVHMKHSGGLYIFPENNRFFQWTGPDDGVKGGAIDFVMREENLSFPEAVGKLIGKEFSPSVKQVVPYEKKEREPLVLPEKADNMKRAYAGLREGYSGGYQLAGSSWSQNVTSGNVYARLQDVLGIEYEGGQYVKYSGENLEYRLYDLHLDVENAPLAPSVPDGITQLNVTGTITVDVPLSFGFGHLPPMQITMKLNAKYVPRF